MEARRQRDFPAAISLHGLRPGDTFDPDYYSHCYTVAYMRDSSPDGVYYFSDRNEAAAQVVEDTLEIMDSAGAAWYARPRGLGRPEGARGQRF